MTTQESTSCDIIRESHKSSKVHTSPTRKQRMESCEEIDEPHTFRHWGLEYSFIPTIRNSFKMSGEQCLRPSINGNLDFFLKDNIRMCTEQFRHKYLRVLPQCGEIIVKNENCTRLPLPVLDDKRRINHIKDDAKQLPQCPEPVKDEEL